MEDGGLQLIDGTQLGGWVGSVGVITPVLLIRYDTTLDFLFFSLLQLMN